MNTTELWISNILNPLLKETNINLTESLNEETQLTGPHGILDSLLLIQFITELENHIKKRTDDPTFVLITPELLEQHETVFKTIHHCAIFVSKILKKYNTLL